MAGGKIFLIGDLETALESVHPGLAAETGKKPGKHGRKCKPDRTRPFSLF
jgi:hypothetical protein